MACCSATQRKRRCISQWGAGPASVAPPFVLTSSFEQVERHQEAGRKVVWMTTTSLRAGRSNLFHPIGMQCPLRPGEPRLHPGWEGALGASANAECSALGR